MTLEAQLLAHCRGRLAAGQRAVIGLNGPVGAGKTTLCRRLQHHFADAGIRLAVASIDDAYLPLADRQRAMAGNPFGVLRVPPGSHDPDALAVPIQAWRGAADATLSLPRFDKTLQGGQGDRTTPWSGPADAVLLEGWLLGCRPLNEAVLTAQLQRPGGVLAPLRPQELAWLQRCNGALAAYGPLWDLLDQLVVLWPQDWRLPRRWRFQAEAQQRRRGGAWLNPVQLKALVDASLLSLPPALYQRPLLQRAAWVRLLDGRRRVVWEGSGAAAPSGLDPADERGGDQASSPSSSATG
jgi:D-glycerate 3-kinase